MTCTFCLAGMHWWPGLSRRVDAEGANIPRKKKLLDKRDKPLDSRGRRTLRCDTVLVSNQFRHYALNLYPADKYRLFPTKARSFCIGVQISTEPSNTNLVRPVRTLESCAIVAPP
jgi:hypothetical protein